MGIPSMDRATSVPWSASKPRRKSWSAFPPPWCWAMTSPGTTRRISSGVAYGRPGADAAGRAARWGLPPPPSSDSSHWSGRPTAVGGGLPALGTSARRRARTRCQTPSPLSTARRRRTSWPGRARASAPVSSRASARLARTERGMSPRKVGGTTVDAGGRQRGLPPCDSRRLRLLLRPPAGKGDRAVLASRGRDHRAHHRQERSGRGRREERDLKVLGRTRGVAVRGGTGGPAGRGLPSAWWTQPASAACRRKGVPWAQEGVGHRRDGQDPPGDDERQRSGIAPALRVRGSGSGHGSDRGLRSRAASDSSESCAPEASGPSMLRATPRPRPRPALRARSRTRPCARAPPVDR